MTAQSNETSVRSSTSLRRRTVAELVAEARRLELEAQIRLGRDLRNRRQRRRLSQGRLAQAAGCSREMVKRMEAGKGGAIPAFRWHAVALALETSFACGCARDHMEDTVDAGHLAIQELLLRLGAAAGFARSVELPTRSTEPGRTIDVSLKNDRRRILLVLEAWNSIGDVGAGKRSFQRKLAEAEALATAAWGTEPHHVAGCWVIRATRRNRTLIARYPEVFATAFPGSSRSWITALTAGAEPPGEPGLVWCDVGCQRLFEWRRHADEPRPPREPLSPA